MRKPTKSYLDAHAEQLTAWLTDQRQGGEGITYAQAVDRLAELDCKASLSRVCAWWQDRLQEQAEKQVLRNIATGHALCRKVETAFAENPAPELETLIALHRNLILQLSSTANADPDKIELVNRMMKPVLESVKVQLAERQTKVSEDKLKLLQEKAAKADQASGVMGSRELTEAEKIARMHELFGIAPK